jgi:hypothetical protein
VKQGSIGMDNIILLVSILLAGAIVFIGVFALIASLVVALDD